MEAGLSINSVYIWRIFIENNLNHPRISTNKISQLLKRCFVCSAKGEQRHVVLKHGRSFDFNAMKFSVVGECYLSTLTADRKPFVVWHSLFKAMAIMHLANPGLVSRS